MSFFGTCEDSDPKEDLNLILVEEDPLIDPPQLLKATVYRRTKTYYGVAQYISIINSVDNVVVSGKRAAYTKFSQVMLDNNDLYKKMGFFKQTEPLAGALNGATPVFFKTFGEAAKEGLVGKLNFRMVASGTTFAASFGRSYTTSVPFSYQIPLTQIGKDLKEHVFKFGNSEYKVQPGSIKERKAKKNTPNLG